MDATIANPFVSNHSEGFHSASPSSSSHDSNPQSPSCSVSPTPSQNQQDQRSGFRSFTPTLPFDQANQATTATVTPPKSPSPPWPNTDGGLSPVGSPTDNEEEPGVRVPAVNSHGKVKTFKCKQCEFVAVTKLDFWEHTKTHIKPERMLKCPKCPFVTEYKHHLEYHMRNHFGSKPFQCPQCNYSCVNKSMLNSHLKSHSNVYQYRCADCNYATKYCHSLKLHLRKYHHQPAMVLNQDGTPNPLPIIDVYGTRRGPKQRPQNKQEEMSPSMAAAPHSIFQFGGNFPFAPIMQHPILFQHNNNINEPPLLPKIMKSPKKEDDQTSGSIHAVSPHVLLQPRYLPDYSSTSNKSYSPSRQSPDREGDPLDLTSSKQEQLLITPPPSTKNRRKGKAFKLEKAREEEDDDDTPIVMQNQVEEIEVSVDIPKFSYDSDDKMISSPEPMEQTTQQQTEDEEPSPTKESFDCMYCDIVFKDIIMYTMHMGYHGFKDPFTCNMCGHRSSDKVAFFVHIARSQHS